MTELCLRFPRNKTGSVPLPRVMESLFPLFVVAVTSPALPKVQPSSYPCPAVLWESKKPGIEFLCLLWHHLIMAERSQSRAVTCAVCSFASGFFGLISDFLAWQGGNPMVFPALYQGHLEMPGKSRVLLERSTEPSEQSTLVELFDFLGLLLALANHQLCFQSVYFNPLLPCVILFLLGWCF